MRLLPLAVLLLCLAAGGVPLVGGPIQAVAGPGLVVAGAGFIGAGLLELGPANLTPFATPVAGNELKTNGVFALSRHPIYAGLVVASAGFSVATVSFQRALVTGMLFLLLDSKSEYEEKKLREVHPAYAPTPRRRPPAALRLRRRRRRRGRVST
ncbi:phospholipid methyltransferase [Aureococcus anophagefferens]|nr:phospholipid methyltransferase [Aureococcus anophagefferens]